MKKWTANEKRKMRKNILFFFHFVRVCCCSLHNLFNFYLIQFFVPHTHTHTHTKRSIFNRLIIGQETYLAFIHYLGFCWLCIWLLDFLTSCFLSTFRSTVLCVLISCCISYAASIGQHQHNVPIPSPAGKLKSFQHFNTFTDIHEIITYCKYASKSWRWEWKGGRENTDRVRVWV